MEAIFISSNSFSVDGLRTDDFSVGRRLKLDCGADGVKYASVVSSEFTTVTTVIINESTLTANLVDVMYSPVKPGTMGNLPDHTHSASEGDGGYIAEPTYQFTGLTDTPATYSGAHGLYAQVSGTQIIFAEGSDIKNFKDLYDTPTDYGTAGYYAASTGSGIEFISTAGLIDVNYFEPSSAGDGSSGYPDKVSMAYVIDTEKWPIAGELVTHKYTNGNLKQTLRGDGEFTSREYYDDLPAFTEEEVIPNLTSNTSDGHTLTSGPTWDSQAWEAFDSSTSTRWIAYPTPATNCWFNIELPFARRIIGYSIRWNGSEGYPQTQSIYGSNNGTDWTLLISNSGISMSANTNKRFDLPALSIKYKHFRFVGTDPTNTNATQITNFEFYGPALATQDSLVSGWTEWAPVVTVQKILNKERAPTVEDKGDYFIDSSANNIYGQIPSTIQGSGATVKTLVLDVADNLGDPSYLGLRSLELWYQGSKITVAGGEFTSYQSSYYNSSYTAATVFNTTLSKTGPDTGNCWVTNILTNQRIICVFNDLKTFDSIVINNYHSYGGSTARGLNNVKIYFTEDTYTDTTYGATVTNSSICFDGQFPQHVDSDVADDQELLLATDTTVYNWGVILEAGAGGVTTFYGLSDTPSSYTGTEGQFAQSTGSGIVFADASTILNGEVEPTTEGVPGNYYVDTVGGILYHKIHSGLGTSVKTLVVDVSSNYGYSNWSYVRAIHLYLAGELVELLPADFTAYSTAASTTGRVWDTSLSLVGSRGDTEPSMSGTSSIRFIVVFNEIQSFDTILINNSHHSGTYTNAGINGVKMYLTLDTYTNTTYNAVVPNSTLIFNGSFPRHPDSDTVQNAELSLTLPPIDYGWRAIIETTSGGSGGGASTFTELTDTPATYSGTEGMYPYSTGSGIDFTYPLNSGDGAPTIAIEGIVGSFYIDETNDTIYKKNRTASSAGFTAKSVVVDIVDNYGDVSLGIRSIEFKKLGSLINVTSSNATGYQTSAQAGNEAIYAFDVSTSKIDGAVNTSWFTGSAASSQRIICVFDSPIEFDEIVVNNYHHNGSYTTRGAKNIKINITPDTITSTVYNEVISNAFLVFDGQLAEHVVGNTADDQVLTIADPSEDTGWDAIMTTASGAGGGATDFVSLTDTPSSYTNYEEYNLKVGATGIEFDLQPKWFSGVGIPTGGAGKVGDYYVDIDTNNLWKKVNTWAEASGPSLFSWDIGSNDNGTAGANTWGTLTDNGDYYTFSTAAGALWWNPSPTFDEDNIDIKVRFRVHNKSLGAVQNIWGNGDASNGIAIGIDATNNLGVFARSGGALTSITIPNSQYDNDKWYIIYASKTKLTLLEDGTTNAVSVTGSLTVGNVGNYMHISYFVNGPSPINAATGGSFDGDVDYVNIYSSGALDFPDYSHLGGSWESIASLPPATYSGTEIYNFGNNTISGTGDIYCRDIYTASGTVYIGEMALSSTDGQTLLVNGGEVSGSGGAQDFLGLTDTPNSYPADGEYISISINGSAFQEDLVNYPLIIQLSDSAGLNSKDLTKFFDEMAVPVDGTFTSYSVTPDTNTWIIGEGVGATAIIADNKLQLEVPINPSDTWVNVASRFRLTGDFDFQVDYQELLVDAPSSSISYPIGVIIKNLETGNQCQLGTYRSSSAARMVVSPTGGTYVSLTGIHYSTGKLRYTRVGSTVKVYYWSGSQWEWNGNTAGYTLDGNSLDGDLQITLLTSGDFDGGGRVTYDNFIINSGGYVWPEGHPTCKKLSLQDIYGNQYYTAIEKWDPENKNVILHSRVPIISTGLAEYRLFYGLELEDNIEYVSFIHELVDKGFTGETFNAPDNTVMDKYNWLTNYDVFDTADQDATINIQNNKLNIASSRNTAVDRGNIFSQGKFTGDFDFQVDWSFDDTTDKTEAVMYVWKDLTNSIDRAYVATHQSNQLIRCNANINGVWDTQYDIARVNDYGKFRISRSGTTLTYMYQDGTQDWQTLGSLTWLDVDCYIGLSAYFNNILSNVTFDNLIINSGTFLSAGAYNRVWDSNHTAVYFLNQTPVQNAGSILDASCNANHAISKGALNSSNIIDGYINKGILFDTDAEFIHVPDGVWDNYTSTYEAFAKIDPSASDGILLAKGSEGESPATNILDFDWQTNQVRYYYEYGNGTNMSPVQYTSLPINPKDGNYHLLVGRIGPNSYSVGIDTYYSEVVTGIPNENTDSTAPTVIGPCNVLVDGIRTYSDYRGTVDFVRISNIIRSNSWSLATNLAMRDQLITYGFGYEAKYLTSSPTANSLEFKTLSSLKDINFTELLDTPDSYFGHEGKWLQTTASGIEFVPRNEVLSQTTTLTSTGTLNPGDYYNFTINSKDYKYILAPQDEFLSFNEALWSSSADGGPRVQQELHPGIRFSNIDSLMTADTYNYMRSKFRLTGDYSITLFVNVINTNYNGSGIELKITRGDGSQTEGYLKTGYDTGTPKHMSNFTSFYSAVRTNDKVALRIIRDGTDLYALYDDGQTGAFSQLNTRTTDTDGHEVVIGLWCSLSASSDQTVDVEKIVIDYAGGYELHDTYYTMPAKDVLFSNIASDVAYYSSMGTSSTSGTVTVSGSSVFDVSNIESSLDITEQTQYQYLGSIENFPDIPNNPQPYEVLRRNAAGTGYEWADAVVQDGRQQIIFSSQSYGDYDITINNDTFTNYGLSIDPVYSFSVSPKTNQFGEERGKLTYTHYGTGSTLEAGKVQDLAYKWDTTGQSYTIFDGFPDYVFSSSFSISLWYYVEFTTSWLPFFGKVHPTNGSQARVWLGNDYKFDLFGSTNVNWDLTSLSLSTDWHHFVVTYNGSVAELFVNGASQGTLSWSPSGAADTELYINTDGNGTAFADGAVDSIKVFTDVLTSTDVAKLYTETKVPSYLAQISNEINTHNSYTAEILDGKIYARTFYPTDVTLTTGSGITYEMPPREISIESLTNTSTPSPGQMLKRKDDGNGYEWAKIPEVQMPIIKDLFTSFNTDVWELGGSASYDAANDLVILVPNELASWGYMEYKAGLSTENFRIVMNGEASGGTADYHKICMFASIGTGSYMAPQRAVVIELDSYNQELNIDYRIDGSGWVRQVTETLPSQLQERFTLTTAIQDNIIIVTLHTDNYYRYIEHDISDFERLDTGLWFTAATGGAKSLRTVNSISIYEDTAITDLTPTVQTTSLLPSVMSAELFIVAGGGSGGSGEAAPGGDGAGGGGGGQVINDFVTLESNKTYDIVIGNGGVAPTANSEAGYNGTDSSFGDIVAKGGGGGGGEEGNATGKDGGNGGGAGSRYQNINYGGKPYKNGFPGGSNTSTSSSIRGGCGGGGANGAGINVTNNNGTNGGDGYTHPIFGTFAGGGGGGACGTAIGGIGGTGGAGNGATSTTDAVAGAINTGGGGGGGNGNNTGHVIGAAGGSGVMYVRYPDSLPPATVTGGPEYTHADGYRTYKFTTNGSFKLADNPSTTKFTDLADTPTTYTEGQYLRTTVSGIEAIDGIILKSPDNSEWLLGVTNSGTLTITGV